MEGFLEPFVEAVIGGLRGGNNSGKEVLAYYDLEYANLIRTVRTIRSLRSLRSLRTGGTGRIGGVLKGHYDGLEKGCACLYSNSKELNFQAQSVGYSLPFAAI